MPQIFEIDVSGEDLLSKNYTICIANKDNLIKGFKFNEEIVNILNSRYGQEKYKYKKSKTNKARFKVRLYCVIIYYLFKSLNLRGDISLNICRDFTGKEDDIKKSLIYFLEQELKLNLNERVYFGKLEKNSNAHNYAQLMRQDNKNLMKTYILLNIEEIEKWIK